MTSAIISKYRAKMRSAKIRTARATTSEFSKTAEMEKWTTRKTVLWWSFGRLLAPARLIISSAISSKRWTGTSMRPLLRRRIRASYRPRVESKAPTRKRIGRGPPRWARTSGREVSSKMRTTLTKGSSRSRRWWRSATSSCQMRTLARRETRLASWYKSSRTRRIWRPRSSTVILAAN